MPVLGLPATLIDDRDELCAMALQGVESAVLKGVGDVCSRHDRRYEECEGRGNMKSEKVIQTATAQDSLDSTCRNIRHYTSS